MLTFHVSHSWAGWGRSYANLLADPFPSLPPPDHLQGFELPGPQCRSDNAEGAGVQAEERDPPPVCGFVPGDQLLLHTQSLNQQGLRTPRHRPHRHQDRRWTDVPLLVNGWVCIYSSSLLSFTAVSSEHLDRFPPQAFVGCEDSAETPISTGTGSQVAHVFFLLLWKRSLTWSHDVSSSRTTKHLVRSLISLVTFRSFHHLLWSSHHIVRTATTTTPPR